MKEKYLEDLKEIRDIMNRSSRFISLSGISGIAAGLSALLGAYLAHRIVFDDYPYPTDGRAIMTEETLTQLLLIAFGTLMLALGTSIFFTIRETRKRGQKVWDLQTRRLLINLFIPLLAGGLVCLIFLFRGYVGFLAPLSLVFYGLALVNASKYTLSELRSLGLIEIGLGIFALYFISFGLWLWAIGFGLLHIVYGLIIQRKYKS